MRSPVSALAHYSTLDPDLNLPACACFNPSWCGARTFSSRIPERIAPPHAVVFGVPLRESLRYANVPISTASGSGGVLYIYGYVPVVVAKWWVAPAGYHHLLPDAPLLL